jgi:hypothetical protein
MLASLGRGREAVLEVSERARADAESAAKQDGGIREAGMDGRELVPGRTGEGGE